MTGSASQVQLRRDTNANVAAYTGPQGEAIYNTETKRLHMQDGVTPGGTPMAKLSEVVTAARMPVADANYTATATDRIIAFTSLTAARAVQLPAASAFPTGVPLWVIDESGACSGANYIAINRNGSDTVSGATSATLNAAYASIALESDGVSKWTVWEGEQNIYASAIGIGTPPDPSNPLAVKGAQAQFNAASNDFRIYMNKVAAANSAGIVFEDAWSARAQIGALGDDNFHGQVSPDGAAWKEWLNVDKTTGLANFPQGGVIAQTFWKADPRSVAFFTTGAGSVSVKAGTIIWVGGTLIALSADTAVTMPALTAGTNYAIYACADGSIRADASFTAPTGYTTANSRQIGGFHYAPGGNALAQAGGDTTPAINAYSLWDLKWRPACPDPRGMTLVAGSFWCDIYLLGVDHQVNGTSAYNVQIADAGSPPKVPTAFGGNGSTLYSALTWYQAAEIMQAYGKDLLSCAEFAAAAYGTTEQISSGADPVTTILTAAYTSKWGVMLATGNMWAWGRDFSTRWDGTGGWNWYANTENRGSLYLGGNVNLVNALVGGDWSDGADAGSRASNWSGSPWSASASIGARGRCGHLILA